MKACSTLEMALLGLVAQKPQSGYDLRKTFATTAMRHYSDSPGSIYPALRRIEARGWIETTAAKGDLADPRRKQDYRLTDAGKKVLIAWLELPVGAEDVRTRQAELMLRFAFMDGNVPRVTTIQFLDQFTRELAIYAAESRTKWTQMRDLIAKARPGRNPIHTGLLAFESGIEGMEAQIRWARKVRTELMEDSQ
ncbi:PadR family transcriptional regulator [Telmatobacter sp. DSM 110680]|uniref:PadR family transcriptional regulator n=1 Tax=Telmatobacter sp. DSM 110680 TaxID=3036704 RepID=A0AAU7DK11_9BACT